MHIVSACCRAEILKQGCCVRTCSACGKRLTGAVSSVTVPDQPEPKA